MVVLVEADCVVVVVLVRESVDVAVVVEVLESVEVAVARKKISVFSSKRNNQLRKLTSARRS